VSLATEHENPSWEEELARLIRALRLAKGFRIYFARSLPGEPRQELLNELSSSLDGGVRVFNAEPGLEHLRSALEAELAKGKSPRAVCVTGIEAWVPAGTEGAESPFVRNLNAARDRFAQALSCPMVIWGANHVLRAIQHGAPDFFSGASGIYLFPAETTSANEEFNSTSTNLEGAALWTRRLAELRDRLSAIPEGDVEERTPILNGIVVLLNRLGRYEEAEPIADEASRRSLAVLGKDHPDTLSSANNLADLYGTTGRYAEAESLYSRTLETRQRVLGEDHPDTLSSANNLAYLYEAVGRYPEAESLFLRTLEAYRRVLGGEHPNTLAAANNLAALYGSIGRYAEAEALYLRTLDACGRVLGKEHPNTLRSANNLADLYETVGRYAEAERLYSETLESRRRMLGEGHPDTLSSVNNLAHLFWRTGRRRQARELLLSVAAATARLPEGHLVRRMIEKGLELVTSLPEAVIETETAKARAE
jgi:tetratricopeptide (TPR) repeat protein